MILIHWPLENIIIFAYKYCVKAPFLHLINVQFRVSLHQNGIGVLDENIYSLSFVKHHTVANLWFVLINMR